MTERPVARGRSGGGDGRRRRRGSAVELRRGEEEHWAECDVAGEALTTALEAAMNASPGGFKMQNTARLRRERRRKIGERQRGIERCTGLHFIEVDDDWATRTSDGIRGSSSALRRFQARFAAPTAGTGSARTRELNLHVFG